MTHRKNTITAILGMLILGSVVIQAGAQDGWTLLPLEITGTTVDLGPHLPVGQYELGVVAVAPTGKSGMAEIDKPLAVVATGTPPATQEALRAKGWYVKVSGAAIVAVWDAATYTVDGESMPAPQYEASFKAVQRIGPCSAPGAPRIQ